MKSIWKGDIPVWFQLYDVVEKTQTAIETVKRSGIQGEGGINTQRFLGQYKYSVCYYYNGEYMSSYICQNS